MNNSSMLDKISNFESTLLCPSQTSTPVQYSHRRSTDANVRPDFLNNASMFCPPACSPIPSAPEEGFFSATRMSNSDGIEHLIEHTPTEALGNLLQNAHNLTQIRLPPFRHRIYCLTRTCHPRAMCPGPMCHPSSMNHPGNVHSTPSAVRRISVTANPNSRKLLTLTTTCTKAR